MKNIISKAILISTLLFSGTSYSWHVGYPHRDTTPPTIPSGLTVVEKTTSSIKLDWQPSLDLSRVVYYKVIRNDISLKTVTSDINDTELTPGTEYVYKIAAVDTMGNISSYSTISASTLEETPPEQPDETNSAFKGIFVVDGGSKYAEALKLGYVKGGIVRAGWDRLVQTKGVLNTTNLCSKISQVESVDKDITLIVYALAPKWVVTEVKANGESTWTNGPLGNSEQPLPWSKLALNYFHQFIKDLSVAQCNGVSLKANTHIKTVLASILGMNDIRVAPTGYDVETLNQVAISNVSTWISEFGSNHNFYFGVFPLNSSNGVNDTNYIRDSLLALYPTLGVYQETWTGAGPSGNLSKVLIPASIPFNVKLQACGKWSDRSYPVCTWSSSDTPEYAYNNIASKLNADYFEIYDVDLLDPTLSPQFESINTLLFGQ